MYKDINISKRLKRVSSYISTGAFFADIGSDHAYLPTYVCLQDPTIRAIAGEVREGPYINAKATVDAFNLSHQVEVKLGNGLEVIDEGVNEVTIAGMGGSLIQTILLDNPNKLKHIDKIIAQPNNQEQEVRSVFDQLGFILTNEEIIEENGHIYEILVGERSGITCYDEALEKEIQYTFGPCLLKEKDPLFMVKWEKELVAKRRILEKIKQAKSLQDDKITAFEKEIQMIEEVIYS